MRPLVLSLFPGIDLFGRAFEQEGYCVVRGPDLLFGQDIAEFIPSTGAFHGIIAGSPCQDFSRARRSPPTGAGDKAIAEFARVVTQARPAWYVLENVPGVPHVEVRGYVVQRIHISAAECGGRQNRRRVFQFGRRDGPGLVIPRADTSRADQLAPCCLASEGQKKARRSWQEFCSLQGLDMTFALDGWSLASKYRAVGNGVPIMVGRAIAAAIRDRHERADVAACVCGCGRPLKVGTRQATPACRKRMQRERDAARVTRPGPVTPAESHKRPSRSA